MTNDKSVTNLAKDLTLGDHKIIFCFLFGGVNAVSVSGVKQCPAFVLRGFQRKKKHKFLSIMKHSGYIVWFE